MLSFGSNADALARQLAAVAERQMPFALAQAMNDAGAAAVKALRAETRSVFDRPTPFTERAFHIERRATKAVSAAVVAARPIQAQYLAIQTTGGTRHPKRKALIVPRGVGLDQYGNIPRGKLKRLLADPAVFVARKRSARTRHLKPGIWARLDVRRRWERNDDGSRRSFTGGGGRSLVALIGFADSASYEPRFAFQAVGRKAAEAILSDAVANRLAAAIATAR